MAREILYHNSVSAFSRWYNFNVPHDRGITDIDGVILRRGQLRGFIEHRTGGFTGSDNDNGGQKAVKRLADMFGLDFEICSDFEYVPGALDTRFALWLVYSHDWPATGHVAEGTLSFHQVFSVRGNVTPFGRRSCQGVELEAYCKINGLDFRHLELLENGEPENESDVVWLQKTWK